MLHVVPAQRSDIARRSLLILHYKQLLHLAHPIQLACTYACDIFLAAIAGLTYGLICTVVPW